MIKPNLYPKLFSVIFGEGMVNDSVSIILYKAILDIVGKEDIPKAIKFGVPTFFNMILQFLKNSVLSIMIGLAFGFLFSF